MKKLTAIPSHYRQLNPTDTIRKGDLKKDWAGRVRRVSGSIGKLVNSGSSTVWRRSHVATQPATVEAKKKVAAVEKNPLVSFFYPKHNDNGVSLERKVRLISSNGKYIIGLEVTDKNRFKKFLATKAKHLKLVEFNVQALTAK